MDQSAQNPSQSTPLPPARKSAMSDHISIPAVRLQTPQPLDQALVQFLITEANAGMANPSHLSKLPNTGVSLASEMSDTEVSKAIANAVDPWSMDQHGGERPQPTSLPVQTLLTAMEFGAMFATDADAAPLFAPGAVSVFVVDDPRQRTRVVDSSDELIAVLRQMPYFAQADGDSLRLISSQTLSSRNFGQKPADMRRTFHKEIDTAIAAGEILVVICDRIDALSDVARTVDFTTYVWPTLNAGMILTLLKQTHSATGQIAEDVIADILPTNAGLASIPPTLLNHAFRATSSLAVAHRLARFETPVVSKPLGLTLSSVKGLPQVCSTLTDMISDLKDWEAGKVAWSDVSASALFYGPPGTGHWKAFFEHDGELASDSVPFAHRTLPLGRCSIECQIDQFRRCVVAGEVAPGADGAPDLRVQGLDGIRGVDQPAYLGWVVEERNDLVPGPAPAGRDRRIPPGQVVILELCQGQFCRLGINGRVDSLEGGRDSFAVFVAGEVHGMAQQVDDAGLDPGLRKGGLDGGTILNFLVALQDINVGKSTLADDVIDEIDLEAPDLIPNCVATILHQSRPELAGTVAANLPGKPHKAEPRPGRNDPCSCGSDRKYKQCCGRN